jgi:hypothetical protein
VFGDKKSYLADGKFNEKSPEQAIKHTIERKLGGGHAEDNILDPDDSSGACKV